VSLDTADVVRDVSTNRVDSGGVRKETANSTGFRNPSEHQCVATTTRTPSGDYFDAVNRVRDPSPAPQFLRKIQRILTATRRPLMVGVTPGQHLSSPWVSAGFGSAASQRGYSRLASQGRGSRNPPQQRWFFERGPRSRGPVRGRRELQACAAIPVTSCPDAALFPRHVNTRTPLPAKARAGENHSAMFTTRGDACVAETTRQTLHRDQAATTRTVPVPTAQDGTAMRRVLVILD
jgi:hypothetical protein